MKLTAVLILFAGASLAPSAELKPPTLKAFEQYAAEADARIQQQQRSATSFFTTDVQQLRHGGLVIQRADASPVHVSGGLIHHWTGAVYVPGVTVAQAVAFMQDYDHLARYYAPEVVESRLLARNGNRFQVAMNLRKHEVLTVVLDTVSNIEYGGPDAAHQWSFSRMDRITEEGGEDHGFLWRMNTYWRFAQASDGVGVGVVMECEVLTLTRDIPAGLGWVVSPFLSSVPKESLAFTLEHTRQGILAETQKKESR